MEQQKQIVVFLAEFDFQIRQIDSIYGNLKKKALTIEKHGVAAEAVESAGYWMHNLYCAFEDLFKSKYSCRVCRSAGRIFQIDKKLVI